MRDKRFENKPYNFNKALKGGESPAEEILPHQPIQAEPLQVEVFGSFERAMRIFRTLCQKERILSIFKEKQAYEKPSDKKRRKKNESKRKAYEASFKTDEIPKEKRKPHKFKQEEVFDEVE